MLNKSLIVRRTFIPTILVKPFLKSVTQMAVHIYTLIYTFSSYRPIQNLKFCLLNQRKEVNFAL